MVRDGTSSGVGWGGECEVPSALLRDVVAYFWPLEVILFGSAGRGEVGADSDFDIAVILPDDAPARLLHWRAANEARRGHAIAVDIVPFRRSAFMAAADEVGSLPWVIAQEGRVVWQREAATAD
jgi:uncharacterized protein